MPPDPPEDGTAAPSVAEADAFDLWLRRGLQSRYAMNLAESLPPALLNLVARSSEPAGLSADWRYSRGTDEGEDLLGQRVRERAYFLWLEEGRPEGRALEHWMAAFVSEVMQEASSLTGARTIHPLHSPAGAGRKLRRRPGEA